MADDAATRARRYRQRKREQAAQAAASQAPAAPSGVVGSVEQDVEQAVAAMKQLEPADHAIVALARRTARQIDLLQQDPVTNASRIFSGLNTLTRILHELGGTPTVRQAYEFRSRKSKQEAEEPDAAHVEQPPAGGNVSALRPRPAKRQRA